MSVDKGDRLMPKFISKFLLSIFFLVLAGCSAPRGNYVILLPEEDGSVGEVSVRNDAGVQTISSVNTVVEIPDDKAPKKPRELSNDIVAKLVAETEAAQPPKPLSFFFFFGFDSAELTEESNVIFASVLAEIATRETVDISLIGHTDTIGASDYNKELGLRRAGNLRDKLIENGIDGGSIDIKSLGEENPLGGGEGQGGRAFNRRVDMVLR